MAKVKICGIMRKKDVDAVNVALPDYAGFVFAESKRQISDTIASEFKVFITPSIKVVGVFVNEDIKRIINLCRLNVIDIIQLHGDEDEDYIKTLKDYVPNKIIKAVRVKSPEDIERCIQLPCDYLLLDTYHKEKYGGTGSTFDWSIIPNINKPYFLAGGINLENVSKAVKLNPYCIDVSSGVETNGVKDPNKIMKIVEQVRKVTSRNLSIGEEEFITNEGGL